MMLRYEGGLARSQCTIRFHPHVTPYPHTTRRRIRSSSHSWQNLAGVKPFTAASTVSTGASTEACCHCDTLPSLSLTTWPACHLDSASSTNATATLS